MKGLLRAAVAAVLVVACSGGDLTGPNSRSELLKGRNVLAIGTDPVTGASIETNKDDYMPGEVVHVVGRGWSPNETVNLHMTEDPDTHADVDTSIVADASGEFSIHFYDVQPHDLGVTFTLTATGESSMSVAVATFYDGALADAPITVMNSATPCVTPNTSFAFGAEVCASIAVEVTGGGANPDLKIEWVNPSNQVAFTQTFTNVADNSTHQSKFTPAVSGAWKVRSCKSSGDCANAAGIKMDEESFTVGEATPTNAAPQLQSISNQVVDEGDLVSFTATATDDDLPAPPSLTFSLVVPASCTTSGATPLNSGSITSGGAFSWQTTETDDGVYCIIVKVTDSELDDTQEVTITVNEVNQAPVIDPIDDVSTQWGVAPSSFTATASDGDDPKNTLTFSLEGTVPSWISINASSGEISFTTIPSSDVGTHTINVRVTDDGDPAMHDEKTFDVEVVVRPTALEYTGSNSGQYSDKSELKATLKDDGAGSLNGTAISGAPIDLFFNAVEVCSDQNTNASGVASCLHQVDLAAQTVKVKATYAGSGIYGASNSAEENFAISEENAEFTNVVINGGNGGSIPVSQTSFTVTVDVKELRVNPGPVEPNPNDGAMPGDISKVTAIDAKIVGLALNTSYNGSCGAGSGGSANYGSVRSFTCTFSNGGNPFVTDAYTLSLNIPTANDYWVATQYDEGMSVWDPAAGFATGGGTFMFDGDRFSFGFSFTASKGKSSLRSGFVVVRHMSDGGTCRIKSNNGMNAPAVNGNTVSIVGKGNYSCTDALGNPIAGQSAGNISVSLYGEDWGTSGKDVDKIWVSNGANLGALTNYIQMPAGAVANAVFLRGGNLQVPQPGGNGKK